MKQIDQEKGKLILRNEQEIRVIVLDSLLAITVIDYVCTFISQERSAFVCTKSLSELEPCLPLAFMRINRNVIVNSDKIVSFNKKKRKIVLVDDTEYDVSVRNISGVSQRLFGEIVH